MKTLFIIRHANAEWKSEKGTDFSRALSLEGIKEAKNIGQQLQKKNIVLDAIFFSNALRTMQTAEIIANACGIIEQDRHAEPSLYLANTEKIQSIVEQFPVDKNNIAIVCHNPGITDFANEMISHVYAHSMPTCAVVVVKSNAEKWSDFTISKKELLFVLSPVESNQNHSNSFSK